MNSASNVAYLLLITHNHNHIETHFIFSIFVTMHRPSSIYVVCTTGKNAVISPDFLVWEFCGKAQFPHNFGRLARVDCAFPQNFHTSKSGEITVFFAVLDSKKLGFFTQNSV